MCELLSKAVRAHGGLLRWRQISSLEGRISIRDAAPAATTPARALSIVASTHLPLICLEDLGPDGRICSLMHDQMRLYRKTGELLSWRSPEEMRAGRARLATQDELDIEDVFDSSATLWVTLNAPFVFTWPGFVTREISGSAGDFGPVRRLLVTFPPGSGSDTSIAVASFDRNGLMRNMCYAAEQGSPPLPTLYTRQHEAHDGIVVGGMQYVHTCVPRPDGTLDRLLLSMEIHELRFR